MAWESLKQRNLADSMLIYNDALKEQNSVHELSDPGLEKQLARNLLFRRFVAKLVDVL